MKFITIVLTTLVALGLLTGCTQVDSSPIYTVEIGPSEFTNVVDNSYFPLIPGAKYVYESSTEDGIERIEVEVLLETKQVMGIPATVVRDRVYLDGELIEDTFDWYAQDMDGNVWYLGEDVSNYENGQFAGKAGSWEAGVDGAMPGTIMFADPAAHIGETYRQEYYAGEAEDMADLISVNQKATVPYGSFDNLVQTKDYTPLEPELLEYKYYANGVGMVKESNPNTGEEVVLMEYVAP